MEKTTVAYIGREKLSEVAPNHPFAGSGIHFAIKRPDSSKPVSQPSTPEEQKSGSVACEVKNGMGNENN
jgi:hypothetical protein